MNDVMDGERFRREEIRMSGPVSCRDVRYIYTGRHVKEVELPTNRALFDKVEEFCFLNRRTKIG